MHRNRFYVLRAEDDDGAHAGVTESKSRVTERVSEECPVCLVEQARPVGRDGWLAMPCGCHACASCVSEHITHLCGQVSTRGTPWPFTCPVCTQPVPNAALRKLVSKRLFNRALGVSLQRCVQEDRGGTLRQCPYGNCRGVGFTDVRRGTNRRCTAPCNVCSRDMCVTCASAATACSCGTTRHSPSATGGLQLRACPDCGAMSHKYAGCPRVKCGACGCRWDWEHGVLVTALDGDPGRRRRRRSKREWLRAGALLVLATGCSVGALCCLDANEWLAGVACASAATFLWAETASRGSAFVSSHAALQGILLGFGLFAHFVVRFAANPATVAATTWFAGVCPYSWPVTLASWTASLTRLVGCGVAWAPVGLACVVAAAEWVPPLYSFLLRM